MKQEFINPFLEAILNVLSTMAQTTAIPGKPILKKDSQSLGAVTGMIGMAGEQIRGSWAITFTKEAILHIASNMLGEQLVEIDEMVIDVVCEITNMVTGGAKRVLAEKGFKFELALPTMISGDDHYVHHMSNGPIIIIPFETEAGNFFVEVCFEKEFV